MIKFTKKIEYSLIALKHMDTKKNSGVSTAKEIAELYRIPRELLAKILQQLTREGYITSVQGPKGGYALSCSTQNINLVDLIKTIEGEAAIIDCVTAEGDSCIRINDCSIRSPLVQINKRLDHFLGKITLHEIFDDSQNS